VLPGLLPKSHPSRLNGSLGSWLRHQWRECRHCPRCQEQSAAKLVSLSRLIAARGETRMLRLNNEGALLRATHLVFSYLPILLMMSRLMLKRTGSNWDGDLVMTGWGRRAARLLADDEKLFPSDFDVSGPSVGGRHGRSARFTASLRALAVEERPQA